MNRVVLVVEDDPSSARLTLEAIKSQWRLPHEVTVVKDGEEAMRYLRREDPHGEARRPDLVMLDLNLPRKNGWEVLAEMKGSASLRSIPVLVFTTSSSDEDIERVYQMQGNCFVTKPAELEDFMNAIREVETFWLKTVALPRRP